MSWYECRRLSHRLAGGATFVFLAVTGLLAQPDPRQMSGIPRVDGNLPDGTITVRVIRGNFVNNVRNHPVELLSGDMQSVVETDAEGRATFMSLSPGTQVQVATTVDGERLMSQSFSTPDRGGVAVLLVGLTAIDGNDPLTPEMARPGRVTIGRDSRILVELGEETIEIYYLLEVLNSTDEPVEPRVSFEFDLPLGAQSGTVLQGSTARAIVDGSRVQVSGSFPPGMTQVRVAFVLPYSSGGLALSQIFPADFDELVIFVEKWDTLEVSSPLISRRGEMAADETGGSALLWGAGGRVPTGQPVMIELSGLPHHSGWPRITALALSGFIVAVSVLRSVQKDSVGKGTDQAETLRTRREKLFMELVRTERQYRDGKIRITRYSTRRGELIVQLERVLRDLDDGLAPATIDRGAREISA